MRLTPLEIRKQAFSRRRLGGVDPEEVQDFLNLVATELEEIVRENAHLREQIEIANSEIHEFKDMEATLRKTLVKAEQMSSESKHHAAQESEHILLEAQERAERVLGDARNRLGLLTEEIEELQTKKDVFLNRFRSLVKRQLDLLEEHRPDYDEVGDLVDEAKDAIERHNRPVGRPAGTAADSDADAEEDDLAFTDAEPVSDEDPTIVEYEPTVIEDER